MPTWAPAGASETLGGAVDAAGALPAQVGARVLEVAHTGFVHSLHAVALASAALSIAMAIAAVQSARQRQSDPCNERRAQMNASQAQEVWR